MGTSVQPEAPPERHSGPRLDKATNSGNGPWIVSDWDRCGEASVTWNTPTEREYVPPGEGRDPERAALKAAQRAATTLRRYCTANRLDRLGSLTYRCRRCDSAPCGCAEGPDRPTDDDLDQVVADIERFRKRLTSALGERIPLACVIEHHKDGTLHVHLAFGRYLDKRRIEAAWGRGWVDLRRFRGPGLEKVGQRERCRRVAGYLTGYLKKDFTEGHQFGRHRYSTTRGLSPQPRQLRCMRSVEGVRHLVELYGSPASTWESSGCDGWDGPPVLLFMWTDPP